MAKVLNTMGTLVHSSEIRINSISDITALTLRLTDLAVLTNNIEVIGICNTILDGIKITKLHEMAMIMVSMPTFRIYSLIKKLLDGEINSTILELVGLLNLLILGLAKLDADYTDTEFFIPIE